MKTLILSVALVLCVASARADDMTGRLGVGGSFGAATSLGMKSVENNHLGLDAGGWLRYGIRPGWSARLTYDHLGINRGTGRVEPILAGLECDMAPKSDWNPNFHFGVGPALVHHLSLVNGKTVVGANLGIGFDHFLTRWFSIGATADWFPALKSYPLQKDINVERIGLLVGFWFGGEAGSTPARAAAVPVPAPAKGGLSEAELAAAAAKLAHPEAVEVTDASRAVESSLASHIKNHWTERIPLMENRTGFRIER